MPKFKKPDMKKKLRNLQNNYLPLIANDVKETIVTRTQSGKDINGRAFKKYSSDYSSKKGGRVNLTVTQQMLNAISWKQIKDGIRFYFNSSEQNAKAHGNQYKHGRKFFGISSKDKKDFVKELQKAYLKALRS